MPTDDRPPWERSRDDEREDAVTGVLVVDDHDTGAPPDEPTQDDPPAGGSDHRRRRRWRIVLAAAGALLFGLTCGYAMHGAGLQLDTTAPAQGAVLNARDAEDLVFRIGADLPSLMRTATLEYDGADVMADASIIDGELMYRPTDLSEGTHTLRFEIDQPFVAWSRLTREWTFTIDQTRPRITIDAPTTEFVRGAPASLSGSIDEPGTVTVDGTPVSVAADGTFTATFAEPPTTPVTVRAMDRAGNERGVRTTVAVAPRAPLTPTRAVHMTAISWKVDELREPVLDMLRRGEINTIELDLKDESGVIGYDSKIPFALRIGAVRPEYTLSQAVGEIHELGGRVIGRVVAFRDPVHAEYAWAAGDRDQVIQDPAGNPYAGYGGFTNFANPVVREYNIAVAREAADAGVDDILFDYVRRPDGPIDTMRFPGLRGTASNSIVTFLRDANRALEPSGAFLGASLFGIAAFQPRDIAQDVPAIARVVDYVAPMLYPSHWGKGSYDIPDPDASPYETVLASTLHFNELTRGTGARVVPWLQDFTLYHEYGPAEVRAQIDAAAEAGVDEWIMWDALVTYTEGAYGPNAPATPEPGAAPEDPAAEADAGEGMP